MNKNIKEWYLNTYPTDDLGQELNQNVTFYDLFETLEFHHDVYDLLGVDDSLIRERVFIKLSEIMGCSYEEIFNQWVS